MEDSFVDTIYRWYDDGRWQQILAVDVDLRDDEVRSLLWAWPSENNLKFMSDIMRERSVEGLVSIGCGTGLFEWLFTKCTNLPVTGIEIDNGWWTCKYSRRRFIPIEIVRMPPRTELLDNKRALMFCFFNNGPAFREYISCYSGDMVFIVGPKEGKGIVTDPYPLVPDFGTDEWKLLAHKKMDNCVYIIAVYIREKKGCVN